MGAADWAEGGTDMNVNANVNSLAKTFDLEIEVEQHQVKDVARAILHTILFQRLIGPVAPRDVQLQSPDITYVRPLDFNGDDSIGQIKCDDASVERDVETAIQHVMNALAERPLVMVNVSFYERQEKRGWLGFGTINELEWERWSLKLSLRYNSSAEDVKKFRHIMERNLHACLMYIVTMSSEYREHVPHHFLKTLPAAFPYRIKFPSGSASGEASSWGGVLRKIITDSTSSSTILN